MILGQPIGGFWIPYPADCDKSVEGALGFSPSPDHPSLMQARLGFRLRRFRQVIQYIGRLMRPATLIMSRLGRGFLQRTSETRCAVTNGKLRWYLESAFFQIPAAALARSRSIRALPSSMIEALLPIHATLVGPDHHQHTQPHLIGSEARINAAVHR